MVVILVAGLLATIVIQHLPGAADKAKRAKAQADIAELKTALDRYYLDSGYYPTTDQGLGALVTPPTTGIIPLVYYTGGYIERLPRDTWGNPYSIKAMGIVRPGVVGPDESKAPTISTAANRNEGVHFSGPTRLLNSSVDLLTLDLASPHEGIRRGTRIRGRERQPV